MGMGTLTILKFYMRGAPAIRGISKPIGVLLRKNGSPIDSRTIVE
jgi:hypothetical protein